MEFAELDRLTPRQREILQLIAKGLTNEEIGQVLGIGLPTVRSHVTAVLAQLQVSNRTEAASLFYAASAEARSARTTAVLARPAIAVLPLLGLDDDRHVQTVAGGLSADLAQLFAHWCWFPVIAQISTAQARTLGATNQQVAAALGARFLVDGSLRRRGDSFRLVVGVDDAKCGHCIWTERYEIPVRELFEFEDMVCTSIVATAYPILIQRVQSSLRVSPRPRDLAAWELAHHAMGLASQREQSATAEAHKLFTTAIEREPTLTLAQFGLGLISYDMILNQWGRDQDAREQLSRSATKCLELAPHAAEGYFLQARYFQTLGDHSSAATQLQAAVDCNPSFAQAHALLAQTLHLTGHSDEGLRSMEVAVRLGPRAFVAGLATLHFMRGSHAEALDAAEQAVSLNPHYTFARVVAAASAYLLGDRPRAHDHALQLRRAHPTFARDRFLHTFGAEVDAVRDISDALQALGVGV